MKRVSLNEGVFEQNVRQRIRAEGGMEKIRRIVGHDALITYKVAAFGDDWHTSIMLVLHKDGRSFKFREPLNEFPSEFLLTEIALTFG